MADLLSWLGDFLGANKGKATTAAAEENKGIVTEYGTTANSLIDTGSAEASDYLTQALNLYGGGDSTLYADALGYNGAEGAARASDAYTTSAGYDFTMDQGLQALDRRNAASGRFSSGNADTDAMNYASGLASQDYQQWIDNLTGATSGAASSLGSLSNLSTSTAGAKTDVAGQVASGLTSANNQAASGKEANQGWGTSLLTGLTGIFGGYGG